MGEVHRADDLHFGRALPASIDHRYFGVLLGDMPLTFDLSTWYAPMTALTWAIALALPLYGSVVSLGGRQLFRDGFFSDA